MTDIMLDWIIAFTVYYAGFSIWLGIGILVMILADKENDNLLEALIAALLWPIVAVMAWQRKL